MMTKYRGLSVRNTFLIAIFAILITMLPVGSKQADAREWNFSRGEYAGDFVKEKETGRIWYVDPVDSRRYQISENDTQLFERMLSRAQVKSWPQILAVPEVGDDREVQERYRIGLMGMIHDKNNPQLLWHVQKRSYKRQALRARQEILEYAKGAIEVEGQVLEEHPIHYSDFEYVMEDPKNMSFPEEEFGTRYGKFITVNVSQQRLRAYENGRLVKTFLVSSGKGRFATKKGMHSVLAKVPVVHYAWVYAPGSADNYDLGNVPYNLRIYPHTYIHYAYWHNNFGRPMSHGCVNVDVSNMKWVYRWADQGVPVLVY